MSKINLSPQPGKQKQAFDCDSDIIIYGGAAGCTDAATEYLTKDGWKFISDYAGEDVAVIYPDSKLIVYEAPIKYIKESCDYLYLFKHKNMDQCISPEHVMIFEEDCEQKIVFAGEFIDRVLNLEDKIISFNDPISNEDLKVNIKDIHLEVFKTEDNLKYCFETSSGYFIARRNGITYATGNSGKSRLLLLKACKKAYKDPNFEGVMFRRTTGPLRGAGGLFTEAKKLFRPLGVHVREKDMEILFKGTGGGSLKFTHLERDSDAESNHQGLQYSFIGFDELTHFTQSQFLYLIGRMRSASEGRSQLMGSCNPDMDSWVLRFVEWYLDKDGYPDKEKNGKERAMLIVNDEPVFADTEQELADKYPELCWQYNEITGENVYIPPLKLTTLLGNIFDNPALLVSNPAYLSALKAQSEVNRKRLLDGCWYARAEGSNYFDRKWLKKIDRVPLGYVEARAWDLASSEPSDANRSPDFTAGVKMYKNNAGEVIIVGDYDESCRDNGSDVYGKFRKRPGDRDLTILKQARRDGGDCYIVLPLDPGAAGRFTLNQQIKFFKQEGFMVKPDPTPNNKSKLKRFEPFSTAAEQGMVSIVESSFPNKATLDTFYKELEAFDGERSTVSRKDDIADAVASCYSFLMSKSKVHKAIPFTSIDSPTLKQEAGL